MALPVYLSQTLEWSHTYVGAFFALWIIAYGGVQSIAPSLISNTDRRAVTRWGGLLTITTAVLTACVISGYWMPDILIAGLVVFGIVFAINSSLHSFLIVNYAQADSVSMDVGFYYMANAAGRLLGTVLSGVVFQLYGLQACLVVSAFFLLLATLISINLPKEKTSSGY